MYLTLQDDDSRIGPKLFLIGLGMTEAANMLLYCQYGEAFEEQVRIPNQSSRLKNEDAGCKSRLFHSNAIFRSRKKT